jgi:hypothetical protein
MFAQLNITCEIIKMDKQEAVFDIYINTTQEDVQFVLGNFDIILETESPIHSFSKVKMENPQGLQVGYCTFEPAKYDQEWQKMLVAQSYFLQTSTIIKGNLAIANVSSPTVVNSNSWAQNAATIDFQADRHCLGRFKLELSTMMHAEKSFVIKLEQKGLHTKFFNIKNEAKFPHVKIGNVACQIKNSSTDHPDIIFTQDIAASNEVQEFLIYPNPASEYLFVHPKNENIKEIKLFDQSGTMIKNVDFTGSVVKIDLSTLIPGNYYIQLSDGTSVFTQQLSKM